MLRAEARKSALEGDMTRDTSGSLVWTRGGEPDLPALLAFASRSLRARLPFEATWHPGDFIWQLKDSGDAHRDMRLWDTPAGLAAVAWFVGPGGLWLEYLPDHEDLAVDALEWAEETHRAARPGKAPLSVRSLQSDTDRIGLFEAMGFQKTGPEGVLFRRALDVDIDPPTLPDGMQTLDCVVIQPEARAACHRDAWNHLAHIGIKNARSTFTAETYLRLRASSVYDPALDILVESDDGKLVANCIGWADAESGIGKFEPVGTHVDYRGRGLARAVTVEGLRRMRAKGLTSARVGTAHFNAPAIATYRSCGFEIVDRTYWWTKTLP
jgi:ribosomal protein S18 acetylase RimI-like enzyme